VRQLRAAQDRRAFRAQTAAYRARRGLRAQGAGTLNPRRWLSTLRARLTLWYTVVFGGLLVLLGGIAFVLLDRGLQATVDDSLVAVARVIAASSEDTAGSDLADTLEGLLGPQLAERFFQLLDPLGRPDPRLGRRGRYAFPLSATVVRNAAAGRETF